MPMWQLWKYSVIQPLYREAMESPNAEKWSTAMTDEHKSLVNNKTWVLVNRPIGAHVVGTRWLYKTKRDENGKVVRFKGRLVAQGF